MRSLSTIAAKDYNSNISSIKEGSLEAGIDTVVSVIRCGTGSFSKNEFEVVNSSVNSLKPLTDYVANGGSTPLFDSVGELVEQLKKVPDYQDSTVSFLVMVITDGQDNASLKYSGDSLSKLIKDLQGTDRWTFVFRVPKGYLTSLVRLGIPEGNIQEWDTTKKGLEISTAQTSAAVRQYYSGRASGQRSTTRFYSDLSSVTMKEVRAELSDITTQVKFLPVGVDSAIQGFVETNTGYPMEVGCAFYQLTKPEKVQGHKKIAIRDKKTGKVFEGDSARDLLGLPKGGEIKLYPGNHGNFDVFIQSTSINRKLLAGTELLYWAKARI